MNKARFTPWVALACIGTLAACTSGDDGAAGNTEVNVIVPNGAVEQPDGTFSTPGLIDIQDVEYTIDCQGNNDQFLDNNASFPDEVTLNGNLEVQDGRTNPLAIYGDPAIDGQAEIWQGFMDLPPGPCTIELRARDGDGEVICTAQEPFNIAADSTTKVNIVLICDISFQAPVGMLDVDGTFSFNVGNFCPDLFILNCLDSIPAADFPHPAFPGTCSTAGTSCLYDTDCPSGETCDGGILLATTTCEVRFRDGDSTCGQGCDPQSCVPNGLSGLTCTPGPDPGVSTTITCTDVTIDCDLNPITTETECTYTGDTLGILGVGVGNPATFAVGCTPPALGGTPGVVGQCTAVTTDGDLDCDKTKVVDVTCPGLSPCTSFGGDAACQAAAGTVCVSSVCNEATCDGATAGACCDDTNVADGTDCAGSPGVPSGPATCQAGVCTTEACTSNAQCDTGDRCLFFLCCLPGSPPACTGQPIGECLYGQNPCTNCCGPRTCDAASGPLTGAPCLDHGDCGTGLCEPGAPQLPPLPPWPGDCPGTLGGDPMACVPNNECTTPGDCPPATAECQVATCTAPTGFENVCGIADEPDGTTCDFTGPGSGDGSCVGGTCSFAPETCNFIQTGNDATPQAGTVQVGCTNNVTAAQSPFPFQLVVDAPVAIFGGSAFSVGLDGIGFFPEFFLDAAQGVVCGGLRVAQLVDFVSTVQVRSGAAGADVPLTIDLATLSPGAVSFCNFPTDQVCTADTECLGGTCEPPILLQDLPVLDGVPNSPGGCDADLGNYPIPGPPTDCDCSACNALGPPKDAQCSDNGFCQNGSLVLQMQADTGNYVAAATGPVLWGWSNQGVPGLSICPVGSECGVVAGRVDGCYQLPPASFALPTPPIGIRVNAGGLAVPIQCAMGEDGGICASGEGCLVDADCGTPPCTGVGVDDDVICPTPDSSLIACPVNSGSSGSGCVTCPDTGVECQIDVCNPADGLCALIDESDGGTCDLSGPGSADGTCDTGVCVFIP